MLKIFKVSASLIFLLSASLWAETFFDKVGAEYNGNPNLFKSPVNVNNVREVLISRPQYVISYSPEKRVPYWVAWKLSLSDLGRVGRQDHFSTDNSLRSTLSPLGQFPVDQEEYRGSCFDRGHQTPSGDRQKSESDNLATFIMSNVAPQTAYLNRNIWEHLESYTRQKVRTTGKIAYIISGTIFTEDFGKIGPKRNIVVPSKNYKIILFLDPNTDLSKVDPMKDSIVVSVPNLLMTGKKPLDDRDELCSEFNGNMPPARDLENWKQFQTNLNEVETESGFKFF